MLARLRSRTVLIILSILPEHGYIYCVIMTHPTFFSLLTVPPASSFYIEDGRTCHSIRGVSRGC